MTERSSKKCKTKCVMVRRGFQAGESPSTRRVGSSGRVRPVTSAENSPHVSTRLATATRLVNHLRTPFTTPSVGSGSQVS